MWRIDQRLGRDLTVEILDLQAQRGPASLPATALLSVCTPAFLAEVSAGSI